MSNELAVTVGVVIYVRCTRLELFFRSTLHPITARHRCLSTGDEIHCTCM